MCLLVTRAPTSPLAVSSLQELDVLCELFEQAAGSSQIASGNLVSLTRLCGMSSTHGHSRTSCASSADKAMRL